jgi:hypothetical protein
LVMLLPPRVREVSEGVLHLDEEQARPEAKR